jgi:hypothetical protein
MITMHLRTPACWEMKSLASPVSRDHMLRRAQVPVSRPEELPENGGGRWPHTGFRGQRWGDLFVGFTRAPVVDCAPLYAGLPGAVCCCPHYGYVLEGVMRCVYPGTDTPDEVARAGELYYFPAGHTIAYDEPSVVIEWNPASALELLMDHIDGSLATWTSVTDTSETAGGD